MSEQIERELSVVGGTRPPKGNTGASSSISVRAGVDWFQVFFYGINVAAEFRAELEAAKQQTATAHEPAVVTRAGVEWSVGASGFGMAACHMAYRLTGEGVTVGIAKRDCTRAGVGPVASFTATGTACQGVSFDLLLRNAVQTVRRLGVVVQRVALSRLDIAVDVDGRQMSDVIGLKDSSRILTRATKFGTHETHGRVETIELGKAGSPTRLVIYDKVAELDKNEMKRAAYLGAHGLSAMPASCTRYEWRLTGEALRESHDCPDAIDTGRKLESIVSYLMVSWYREAAAPVDRENKNQSKAAICPEWQEIVVKALAAFSGSRPRQRKPMSLPVRERQLKQIAGLVASLCASLKVLPEDAFQAVELLREEISADAESFRAKVMLRAKEYGRLYGKAFSRAKARSEAMEIVSP